MRRAALITMVVLSAVLCHGQANCFAHTSVQLGPPNVSAPMDDTGATVLVAFTTAYAAYTMVKDVTGGPNTWYQLGYWGMGNALQSGISVFVAINPVTNTAATFQIASGQSMAESSAQIWACNGVNTTDLFYQASGELAPGNGPNSLGAAIGPTDTTITIRGSAPTGPIKNGDYGHMASGSVAEYFLVTDASNQTSLIVQRGMLGTTPQSWVLNQAMFIGGGIAVPSCSPPAAVAPSAVGDLEFVAAGRAGSGTPPAGTTATINVAGFSTPTVVGGAPGGAGTTVVSWRTATDLSTFQPTLTMSASDQWGCVGLVLKGSASPSSTETPPLAHTVVGNGYQCNNPGGSGSDCPAPAPGDGGPPLSATLNWPSEVLWYKHGVPPDKVMVFVDNQANLLRAVNFDTVPHTVANVVIQPNTIRTIAGTGNQAIGGADGGCTGNNGPALSATMLHPVSLGEDPTTGNLAVGDQQCASIDVVDTAGNFHWAVGGGPGGTTSSGCGVQHRHGNLINVPATQALLNCVQGGDYDANGNLIVADSNNNRLVFVNLGSTTINAYGVTGIQPGYVVPIAGAGNACTASYTSKPALSTLFTIPLSIYVNPTNGDVYFSGTCTQILKLTAAGQVVMLAGIDESGNGGITPPLGYSPDGTPANGARFGNIFRASLGVDGLVHFTDTDSNLIRHIDAQGLLRTEMGNYVRWGPKNSYMGGGWYGDNGSASRFQINYPVGYAYDSQGRLCVSSLMSNIIACASSGTSPPTPAGGAFIAAGAHWVSAAMITGAAVGPEPIYGGVGQPGATTATLSGNTVILNDSANSVLPQLQASAETPGQSWSFTTTNQVIYLILFNSSHSFIDDNGHTFVFNPPIVVNIGGRSMYMYQTYHPLFGTYTVKVAS